MGLRPGSQFSHPDAGHFEVNSAINAYNARKRLGVLKPGEQSPAPVPLEDRTLRNFLGGSATKPDLTNNPADIHYPGSAMDYGKLFGGTKSSQTDQGAALYQFPNLESGYAAMETLANDKYKKGMLTANQLIAGQGGFTPGALGKDAAKNIAKAMGIGPDDDLKLSDPARMRAFKLALSKQEGSEAAYKWLQQHQNIKAPPLGNQSSWHRPSNQIAMNQKTDIHVHGVDNPQEAAQRVGRHQTRINSDLLKNTAGTIG